MIKAFFNADFSTIQRKLEEELKGFKEKSKSVLEKLLDLSKNLNLEGLSGTYSDLKCDSEKNASSRRSRIQNST